MGAIEFAPSQTSRFVDQPEDGDGLQEEAEERALEATDSSRIERWRDRLNEVNSSDGNGDWHSRTIDFGESCSVIADGLEGLRIARWNLVRGEDWQTMLKQDFLKPEPAKDDGFRLGPSGIAVSVRSRASSCTW